MAELPRELIDGILADPDSDAPRLVAADWFDDAGDSERAEFIRLQCQIARMQAMRKKPRVLKTIQYQADQLLGLHRERWLSDLLAIASNLQRLFTFERGFVSGAWIDSQIPFETLSRLIPYVPLVQTLSVSLDGILPTDWVTPFIQLRDLRSLRIHINRDEITWEELKAFVQLPRLQHFDVRRSSPYLNLIPAALRRRFNAAREQHHAQTGDEPARLAALRSRLNHVIRSTTSGLDSLVLTAIPQQELKLAATLTTLRSVQVSRHAEVHLKALAALTMLRTLTLWQYHPQTPQLLGPLTGLREVDITTFDPIDMTELGDWLVSMPDLEMVRLTVPCRDVSPLLARLSQIRSLRVLHLAGMSIRAEEFSQYAFPELIELDSPIHAITDCKWVTRCPQLRLIRTPAASPKIGTTMLREHGILMAVNPMQIELVLPWFSVLSNEVELAHGIRMQVPNWLHRVEPANSPHSTADIEPLAAWQEFGPGDEWPDLRTLAPTRIWLERIEVPAGTLNAREWLTTPATPFANPLWSNFIAVSFTNKYPPRVMIWRDGMRHGLRAVWMGKHHLIRLTSEFTLWRKIPWEVILQLMVGSVQIPK